MPKCCKAVDTNSLQWIAITEMTEAVHSRIVVSLYLESIYADGKSLVARQLPRARILYVLSHGWATFCIKGRILKIWEWQAAYIYINIYTHTT